MDGQAEQQRTEFVEDFFKPGPRVCIGMLLQVLPLTFLLLGLFDFLMLYSHFLQVRCGGGADEAIDASRCFFDYSGGNRSRSGDELVTGTRLGHLPT